MPAVMPVTGSFGTSIPMVQTNQMVMQNPQSFVPPMPLMPASQSQALLAGAGPQLPVKLTEGIPTVEQIASQKGLYAAALDKQLQEAQATITKEVAIEKQMVTFATQKDIALYEMQVDERLTEALAQVDEQATMQILELKKAFVERQLQLNAQANGLMMEYNMNQVHAELAAKQQAFQQQLMQVEKSLAGQYAQQMAKAATPTTSTAAPADGKTLLPA